MRSVLIGLVAAAATACAPAAPAVTIEKPEIRASLGETPTAAAYLTIRNEGASADRLLGAACACAAMVMPHQTTTTGGVARMSHEPAVPIPARGAVTFQPGGRHLMLTGLTAPIRAGQKVTITLTFEKSGPMPVRARCTSPCWAGRSWRWSLSASWARSPMRRSWSPCGP